MFTLNNLKSYVDDMEQRSLTLSVFTFVYKKNKYFVFVKRFSSIEKKENKYAIAKLEFLKQKNNDEIDYNNTLIAEVDMFKIYIDAKSLRDFFNIEYKKNLGDILKQFTNYFNEQIPTIISESSQEEKIAISYYLNKNKEEESNKIYCYKLKLNPKDWKRSESNSRKSQLLKPLLFKKIMETERISFCYTDDPRKEAKDSKLLEDLAKLLIKLKK
ncbi:DUF6037 family protein [Mycoplasmopsis gallinarum]